MKTTLVIDRRSGAAPSGKDEDRALLNKEFYEAFDQSLLESKAVNFSKLQRNSGKDLPNFLGEGFHFSSFLVERPGSLQLVLKIAGQEFLRDQGALKGWQARLAKVKKFGLELIPPFELIEWDEQVALVMPYGDQDASSAKPEWLPLSQAKAQLMKELALNFLQLEDHIQIRCFKGIPFVVDLSDLNSL